MIFRKKDWKFRVKRKRWEIIPTRGLTAVKYGDTFIGIANNFDSNINNLGKDVLVFIKKVNDELGWNKFKENLKEIDFIVDNYESKPSFNIKFYDSGKIFIDVLNFNYDVENGEFLYLIYDKKVNCMINQINFGKDGLFCEYGYVINLDTNMIEFYIGNKRNFISKMKGLFPNDIFDTFENNSIIYYSIQKILEYSLNFTNVNIMLEKMKEDYQIWIEECEKV